MRFALSILLILFFAPSAVQYSAVDKSLDRWEHSVQIRDKPKYSVMKPPIGYPTVGKAFIKFGTLEEIGRTYRINQPEEKRIVLAWSTRILIFMPSPFEPIFDHDPYAAIVRKHLGKKDLSFVTFGGKATYIDDKRHMTLPDLGGKRFKNSLYAQLAHHELAHHAYKWSADHNMEPYKILKTVKKTVKK